MGPSEVSFALRHPCPKGARSHPGCPPLSLEEPWSTAPCRAQGLQTLGLRPSLPQAGQAPSKASLCSPLARGEGSSAHNCREHRRLLVGERASASDWHAAIPGHFPPLGRAGSEEGSGELGTPGGAAGLATLPLFASPEASEKGIQSQATQRPGWEVCPRCGSPSSCQGAGKGIPAGGTTMGSLAR